MTKTRRRGGSVCSSGPGERPSGGDSCAIPVSTAVEVCREAIAKGGTIFVCGNGGSAAMASHFAAELVVRYAVGRRPLPCVNLAADVGILTACANDLGYFMVFARQLDALGRAGDVLIVLSTSGSSENILEVLTLAEARAIEVLDPGSKEAGESTAQCQERHLKWLHGVAAGLEDWAVSLRRTHEVNLP